MTSTPRCVLLAVLAFPVAAFADDPPAPPPDPFVSVKAPVVALTHVRVVDGTGAQGRADQTILIRDGKLDAIGPAAKIKVPSDAKVLDLHGRTALPGLVGMHEHLFYTAPIAPGLPMTFVEQPASFPRLYLAGGVTTARTGGSLEPYADLSVKRMVDAGMMPGPRFFLTAPYLEGKGSFALQMNQLATPEATRRMVAYWADEGFTSFKAYMFLTRDELAAAIDEAHKRKLKVTGHLCAISFTEAADLGIDNLEHGFLVDTDDVDGKKPDACAHGAITDTLEVSDPRVKAVIQKLVTKHVAVTSTLAVFESALRADQITMDPRWLDLLIPESRDSVLATQKSVDKLFGKSADERHKEFARELAMERAFVRAGGVLLAGCDPTGYGATIPGFCDQRELELLVEAGFSPAEAIHIGTQNGARFLGVDGELGTLSPGKRADIVVVTGDPEKRIADVEKVEIVFKDGVGYDPEKLRASVKGKVGLH